MDKTLSVIQKLINNGSNKVNVIKRSNNLNMCETILNISENSFLGTVINATGGIIFGNCIKHFGGENEYNLTIQSVNNVVNYHPTVISNMLIVAMDIFGGVFAIDCGAFTKENVGNICYLPPDGYTWEFMNFSHATFLEWCISGDLQAFYLPTLERINDMKNNCLQFDEIWSFVPDLWHEDCRVSCYKRVDCEKMLSMRLEVLSIISNYE